MQSQLLDNTVTVVFDNMPFTTPGKNKKYVMVSLDFTQSTTQPQGAAVDYYGGSITCGVMTPKNKGTADGAAIAESVIDGLTSVKRIRLFRYIFCFSPCITNSWTNYNKYRKRKSFSYL